MRFSIISKIYVPFLPDVIYENCLFPHQELEIGNERKKERLCVQLPVGVGVVGSLGMERDLEAAGAEREIWGPEGTSYVYPPVNLSYNPGSLASEG